MRRFFAFGIVLFITAQLGWAAQQTFNVTMTGEKEILPNVGDAGASAIGPITLDTNGTISWNLSLSNLSTPPATDFHIHTGTASQNGGILIPIGVNTGGGDILTQSTFSGTRSGLSGANITTVLANPGGFYFNIHNNDFPGGAVRDQVPEPSMLAVVGLAAAAMLLRRRQALRV